MNIFKKDYWQINELITIGIFAVIIRISSYLIAITGGGMNPLAFLLKNITATAILIVLVSKIKKYGTLTLYTLVVVVISFLFGKGSYTAPGILLAGLVTDLLLKWFKGYDKLWQMALGVLVYETFSRLVTIGVSLLFMRESSGMIVMAMVSVGLGYIGCLLGVPAGIYFTKELKHAGIVRR